MDKLEGPKLDTLEPTYFLTCMDCFFVFNPPNVPGECPNCLAVDSLKLTEVNKPKPKGDNDEK